MIAVPVDPMYLDEHEVAWIRNTTTKIIIVKEGLSNDAPTVHIRRSYRHLYRTFT